MQKVNVVAVILNEDNVIISSPAQFTGILDNSTIYAKCVYGDGPEYVMIPVTDTKDCTDEYALTPDFKVYEIKIPEEIGIETLEKYLDSDFSSVFHEDVEAAVTSYLKNVGAM